MKKFTKLFLSCAAVAAVTASVATTAMAADISSSDGLKGSYDAATNKVTLEKPADADAAKEMTFLVFEGETDTSVAAEAVIGIDQNTGLPENTGLIEDSVVGEEDPEVTYTVKLGYYPTGENSTFTVLTGTFKAGKSEGVEFLVGDADSDGEVIAADASEILKLTVNKDSKAQYVEQIDTDSDGDIIAADASNVLKFTVNKPPYGSVNQKITVANPTPIEKKN